MRARIYVYSNVSSLVFMHLGVYVCNVRMYIMH